MSNWDLQSAIEKVQNDYKQDGLFAWMVDADLKNSSVNIIQLEQGGLTLPGRDYYINKTLADDPVREDSESFETLIRVFSFQILQALKQFIVKICILLGGKEKEVEKQAEEIIQFETRLAQVSFQMLSQVSIKLDLAS